ncbi:MAG: hypothetical protein JSS29_07630 [Proteobacteria bacterium]|nr:hypothetical protein [Pseudomonadota bacterium]
MSTTRTTGGAALLALIGLPLASWAGSPPDILGVHTGMAPQEAYETLRGIDPGHNVALNQLTVPELYGERPVTFAMTPTTTGSNDQVLVSLTLPPQPQQVWQVHRLLIGFAGTLENLTGALHQKYGDQPFNSGIGGNPAIDWFFDAAGSPVRPTDPAGVLALKNCMNAQLQPFNVTPTATTGSSANLIHGVSHTTPLQFPPSFDPAANPQCQNLVWVHAVVLGGANASLEVTISDYTLQHRTAKAYSEAINAAVNRGQQAAQQKLQQQGAPKL